MQSLDILGLEVPLGQIEAQLRKLWELDQASTKASLINFAIYSESPDALASNTELLSEITRDHSCRALIVAADRTKTEAPSRAWITAHCHLAGGRKAVCSEQIAFLFEGKTSGRIRNTLFAHLEPDLPLILWWQGEFSEVFEPRLYNFVDRLLFDSAEWIHVRPQISALLDSTGRLNRPLVFHDIEWSRSHYLRRAVAQLFDNPSASSQLKNVEAVELAHHPDHRFAAVHLSNWLATLLGWELLEPLPHPIFVANNREIPVVLKENEGTNTISSFEIRCPEACFEARRDPGAPSYLCSAEVQDHTHRHVAPADPLPEPRLISSLLGRGGNNALFRRMLPMFGLLCSRL